MFEKRLKAVDLAKGTNIAPSVISRYLSGQNQPSRDNIITIGNYLGAHPQSLLSSSDAPESKNPAHNISIHKDKIILLLERMVAEKDEQIISLKAEIKQWEDIAITISVKDRHAKGRQKTKNPTKPNKQKVGFMTNHKKAKS